jgi:hypothetical protein
VHELTQEKDSTIICFPIPSTGLNARALSWQPPLNLSARIKDVTTKGDIMEIEMWQLIAPLSTVSSDMDGLDYDTLSYSTNPVRGELLGLLDLTAKPNGIMVEFACPSEAESLVVEAKSQRVACHVSFMQTNKRGLVNFLDSNSIKVQVERNPFDVSKVTLSITEHMWS